MVWVASPDGIVAPFQGGRGGDEVDSEPDPFADVVKVCEDDNRCRVRVPIVDQATWSSNEIRRGRPFMEVGFLVVVRAHEGKAYEHET